MQKTPQDCQTRQKYSSPAPLQVFLVINPTCIGYSLKIQSGANHYLTYPHTYIHTGILHSEPKSTAPPPTFFFFFLLPDADTPSLGKIWKRLLQLSVQKLLLPAQESNSVVSRIQREPSVLQKTDVSCRIPESKRCLCLQPLSSLENRCRATETCFLQVKY